ncbi:hypothetical protein JOC75_000484 [Metabacillus crassostreae]|uniref:hypothetical protein n=1 Tax=Metabacillus crassostreae TaxID=929098 RepID=UPI001958F11C|nr:hypothetical protein [Metabacillus crassostreae]MBM7602514.1 hypothetical protein [Metabacillus crassostreae]
MGNYRRNNNNVAGVSDEKLERLADIFDEDFKVPVRASIDGEDFCDAVRRCLINDLVNGLLDEEDRPKKRHRY